MNIYVGNLPFNATEDEVKDLFVPFGNVTSVALIKDKMTGQPRGFGFVEMASDDEAQKAITALNGKEFKNRAMVVNAARPREERGFGGGGGGRSSGGGGYGGGYGGGGDRRGGGGSDRRGGGRSDSSRGRSSW